MFSKQDKQRLTKEFWTVFGKAFPRKWLLYDTKIKDFSFKFSADTKSAMVALDMEMRDDEVRHAYFDKLWSLENVIAENLPGYQMEKDLMLENGKMISRIWVQLGGVSIYNKDSWRDIFEFFVKNMSAFEDLFFDWEDFIKSAVL